MPTLVRVWRWLDAKRYAFTYPVLIVAGLLIAVSLEVAGPRVAPEVTQTARVIDVAVHLIAWLVMTVVLVILERRGGDTVLPRRTRRLMLCVTALLLALAARDVWELVTR